MCSRPDRLEQTIGEPQRHDVLDRFLAEEMIDPIDLMFRKGLQDLGIERLGRSKIVAERFFDHHPAPVAVRFRCETGGAEAVHYDGKKTFCHRKVKQIIAARTGRFVQALPDAHSAGDRSPDR